VWRTVSAAGGSSNWAWLLQDELPGVLAVPAGIVVDASGALRVSNGNGTITTYPAGANGNVAPVSRLTISRGAARPFGVSFDPSGDLLVADAAGAQVDTFAASAAGSAPPLSLPSGTPPAPASPVGLDLDVFGDIFVPNRASNTISEYSPQIHGSSSPLAMIAGPSTGLETPSLPLRSPALRHPPFLSESPAAAGPARDGQDRAASIAPADPAQRHHSQGEGVRAAGVPQPTGHPDSDCPRAPPHHRNGQRHAVAAGPRQAPAHPSQARRSAAAQLARV
jgi:hypothetical protein